MLHIINKSPFTTTALTSCLDVAQSNDVIVLIEDAVVAARINTAITAEIMSALKTKTIYALKTDLEARGLNEQLIIEIKLIDYREFVELTVQHHPIQSWN